MDVRLLYFDDCPNWEVLDGRLRELADELGFELGYEKVETPQEAEERQFRGSPSLLVDGRDPFEPQGSPVGLSCRVYPTPSGLAGSPTVEQLREALS